MSNIIAELIGGPYDGVGVPLTNLKPTFTIEIQFPNESHQSPRAHVYAHRSGTSKYDYKKVKNVK